MNGDRNKVNLEIWELLEDEYPLWYESNYNFRYRRGCSAMKFQQQKTIRGSTELDNATLDQRMTNGDKLTTDAAQVSTRDLLQADWAHAKSRSLFSRESVYVLDYGCG